MGHSQCFQALTEIAGSEFVRLPLTYCKHNGGCFVLPSAQRLTLFAGSSSFADAGEAGPLIRTKHIRSKSEHFVQSGQQSRAFLLAQLREILRAPLDRWQRFGAGNIEQRPLRFTTFE